MSINIHTSYSIKRLIWTNLTGSISLNKHEISLSINDDSCYKINKSWWMIEIIGEWNSKKCI